MPLPRSLARLNRHLTNRVLGPLARYAPGFGVVIHRGRQSGRVYRTPVNVFARPGGLVVALTYGPRSDWVRNVLAAGGCSIETRGRRLRLGSPRLVHDESYGAMPPVIRLFFRLGAKLPVKVSDFLELTLIEQRRSTVPSWVGPFNAIARRLLAAGVWMGPNGLLTVAGRRTGLPRTTPVTLLHAAGKYWVMGVYGEVDWVRNLRAAGRATALVRGRRQAVTARELTHSEAVAFFRDTFAPLVRRYGGLGAWIVRHVDKIDIHDPVAAARGRPVFELSPTDA